MSKQAFYFIDDVIWCLRDITRQKADSVFCNSFFKMLKKANEDYGMTVQLNVFYRTDFFYGDDEFTLTEVTDRYKKEFEDNSNWLKFAFHAKQEFPDYPYINISYEDAKNNYTAVKNEIIRFAGEKSLSNAVILHWGAMSKAGCRALKDCGVKFLSPSVGERYEFNGDNSSLPYGHAARLKQNRQPETMLFTRNTNNKAITASICSYNYINAEQHCNIIWKNASLYDDGTGLYFKRLADGPCLNLFTLESLEEKLDELKDYEYVGIANHEQYFYPDYYAYQNDYADKTYLAGKILKDNGFTFITADNMK